MKSSSIFSSKTLESIPRPAQSVWLALGLLVAVRLALHFASEALFLIPENDFDKLYLMNEARYRLSQQPQPKVIVMGTSRMGLLTADCLAPRLGVDAAEVTNYSLAGNSFWRTLLFFRRNPRVLENAQVVIIDLLPYQLYRGPIFTEDDELFLRLATLEERAEVGSPVKRAKAFTDLLFPVWSERHNPAGWRRGLALLPLTPDERYREFLRVVSVQGNTIDLRKEAHEAGAATTPELGRGYAPEPMISQVQVKALDDLRAILPKNCLLLLAWLPVRQDFAQAFETDPTMSASYRVFKDFISKVDGPNVAKLWLDNSDAQYIQNSDVSDVVHFTRPGMEKVCGWITQAIIEARARRK